MNSTFSRKKHELQVPVFFYGAAREDGRNSGGEIWRTAQFISVHRVSSRTSDLWQSYVDASGAPRFLDIASGRFGR